MPSPLNDPGLERFLADLHAQSDAQTAQIEAYIGQRAQRGDLNMSRFDQDMHRFFADKMVTLDRDKAELCYVLCRALRAANVVEAGTSFGVSTLYLAAAVRDNKSANGKVIATEYEPAKAAKARSNFAQAGLADYIELREGDLRETLQEIKEPVDFMLIDIWDVALPALRLVAPHLRPGAIVACDNTTAFPDYYVDYFAFVNDPANRLRTMTLPFAGGFEVSVRI